VLIKPFRGKTYNNEDIGPVEELDKLSPLKNLFEEGFAPDRFAGDGFPKIEFDKMERARWIPSEHFITKGIPFEIFPYDEMAYYPYEAAGDVIIRSETGMPIAAVKEYGKGRIVAFGYYPRDILPQHADFKGNESTYDPIIENLAGSRHSLTFNYLEHFYGLIYRSMIWASRKESDCAITAVNTVDGGLDVTIQGNKSCIISYRVNNAYDEVVYEGKSDIRSCLFLSGLNLAENTGSMYLPKKEKVSPTGGPLRPAIL
jgi:hypothetical protein